MRKINKKGFTLVELLAVIVVLAIVMSLAVVAITGVLDNARKASFVADAKSFLEGARNIVTSAELNAMLDGASSATYQISCDGNQKSKDIPISDIKLQQGGKKSPYGMPYDSSSKITVTATKDTNNDCNFVYTIYLTDTVYKIDNVEWNSLTTADVKPANGN